MSQQSDKTIRILHLYPNEMNIYGDHGNILTIERRLQWHNYKAELVYHHPGKPFPNDIDIIIGGGGQDSGQDKVQADLLRIGSAIHQLADRDVPMLMICGLYQLFGRFFKTQDGHTIPGISIFKSETHAGPKRLTGNIVTDTLYGEVIGYENHSGQTFLDKGERSFGYVLKGAGNNGKDKTEGAVYRWVFGSYLHGSPLPKNPSFADSLIERAVVEKYGEFKGRQIDDDFALQARAAAKSRPR